MLQLILAIIRERCPFCFKGKVYKKAKPYQMPVMLEHCEHCKRDFIGEPGYYFGSMYVSYGIAVVVGISIFILFDVVLKVEEVWITIAAIISGILFISIQNFKWSRIVWLKLFPPGSNTRFSDKQG